MVVSDNPPGSPPSHIRIASNNRLAMPERSSMAPMKMNSGIAANTKFLPTSSIRLCIWAASVSPKRNRPNAKAVDIRLIATGIPRNTSPNSMTNINTAFAPSNMG